MAKAGHEGPNLTLRVHPEIAKALKTRESLLMDELEQPSHKHIIIQFDATLHLGAVRHLLGHPFSPRATQPRKDCTRTKLERTLQPANCPSR